jgi:hypothetical protein
MSTQQQPPARGAVTSGWLILDGHWFGALVGALFGCSRTP